MYVKAYVAHMPPIQWVLGALFPEVKRLEPEAYHSPRLRIRGAIPAFPPYVFIALN
jgi:hypothetical protein